MVLTILLYGPQVTGSTDGIGAIFYLNTSIFKAREPTLDSKPMCTPTGSLVYAATLALTTDRIKS